MATLRREILGKVAGDFRLDHFLGKDPTVSVSPRVELLKLVREKIKKRFGLEGLFTTRSHFTNRVVAKSGADQRWTDWFIISREVADGGIVEGVRQAVVYFTADCPITAVYDPIYGRLGVLHSSFRCLVSKGGLGESIVRALFREHGFSPQSAKVFVGFGIGPCCYGIEHFREDLWARFFRNFTSHARRGPREGQLSFDLHAFIVSELLASGVPIESIEVDYHCTACDESFHSHCREGPEAGRNAALAWLE